MQETRTRKPPPEGELHRSCPLCGNGPLHSLGIIYHPEPTRVAGIAIDLEGIGFHLMGCRNCGFQFKSPAIAGEKLLACYAAAETDHWGLAVDPRQRNFDRLAAAIRSHASGRRILDIGCFNGAFLDYLGSEWDRFGVEPCLGARQLAGERGVEILADTLDSVPEGLQFDVITAFDVIEHIVDPRPFFERLRRHLAPGGIFVASSGDTDALSWRLQKARYWYCSYLPEHVSFYNLRSLNWMAGQQRMETVLHTHMSHKRTSLATRWKQAFNGTAYAVLMRTGWLGLPYFRRKFAVRAGTEWAAARDHFIHVMRAL